MLLHVRLVRGWSRVDTLYCFKCKNRRLSNVHISSLIMSFLFFSKPFQWSVFLPYKDFMGKFRIRLFVPRYVPRVPHVPHVSLGEVHLPEVCLLTSIKVLGGGLL